MKGTPASPQCGFSRQACHLLDEHKIKFNYFDVLADQNVREQLKRYSNWNTYPQVIEENNLVFIRNCILVICWWRINWWIRYHKTND
jgi:glutaredoxin-related protein